MKYLLLIYGNEAAMLSADKKQVEQMMAAYGAYTEAMKKAGAYVGGERLRPTGDATTVRGSNGKSQVLNGPYAETKEQLGGYYMIDAPDLDAALSWASRCPGAQFGAIEVRPIWPGCRRECRVKATRRAKPRRRWRAEATASWSPSSRRARATSPAPRMRCPRRSRRRSATGPPRACPKNPEAWLLTAARRKQVDAVRRQKTRSEASDHLRLIAEELEAAAASEADIPDERLRLMFACAHPALEEGIRAPLILQTILGFDAATIASAFLVSPATMGQRLVRAKSKMKIAGIPFRVPERSELGERLEAVLSAIYAAFSEGWSDPAGIEARRRNLAEEGIWLGPARRLAHARRAGGARASGADAPRRSATRRAAECKRRLHPACRAGPGGDGISG